MMLSSSRLSLNKFHTSMTQEKENLACNTQVTWQTWHPQTLWTFPH